VAGSIITVAGVVFSITIAALTQASSQFGPRLLRNFMRDKSNQVVLGTFVATFLYCLLVLRTIHGKVEDGSSFVPQASVTGAVLLAVASMAVLIYFIHHVSISLQAPNVVAAVRAELLHAMDEIDKSGASQGDGGKHDSTTMPAAFDTPGCPVQSNCDGYVQAVDYQSLIETAEQFDLLLRLEHRPGDYIMNGETVIRAWPADRCDERTSAKLNSAFICGGQRTAEQDLEYGIRQMVEVAVRALSPAINDPFTAINCLDALGSIVCRAARSKLPAALRFDQSHTLRLVTPISTFAGITDAAFNQIRQYARGSVAVNIRLLETLDACCAQIADKTARQALLRHAEMIFRQSQDATAIPEIMDRADVQTRWENLLKTVGINASQDVRKTP
jgi:uncharacterized membrane protein